MEKQVFDKISPGFYQQEVLDVAPLLLGKILVRGFESGKILRSKITEVEAYNGMDDKACHASKGKTERNKVMFQSGGLVYVYLIYGMHWLLNIVTGREDSPQAALIRGLEGLDGPGRVGKALELDKSFYGENLSTSPRIWIEDSGEKPKYITAPRVGINYAGEYWKNIEWRFIAR